MSPVLPRVKDAAFVSRYPLKAFASQRSVRLPVRIKATDRNVLQGFERTIAWSGYVELTR